MAFIVVLVSVFVYLGRYTPNIPPAPPMPNPNGFDDFLAACKIIDVNGGDKQFPKSSDDLPLAQKRYLVMTNKFALDRLRQGITKQFQDPIARNHLAELPHLKSFRQLASLVQMEGDQYSHNNQHAQAISSYLDGIEFGIRLQSGGMIIHDLIGSSVQTKFQMSIIAELNTLSKGELLSAAKRLDKIVASRPTFAQIFETEMNNCISFFSQQKDGDLAKMVSSSGTQNPNGMIYGLLWHVMRDRTLHDMEGFRNASLAEINKDYALRKKVSEPDQFASMFVPVFANASDHHETASFRTCMLSILMKVRAFKLDSGNLPLNLKEAGVTSIISKDPFSNSSIIYNPAGNDFLLYSVGPDGKDNGGVTTDESNFPYIGDIGVRSFRAKWTGSAANQYHKVPHMKLPILPLGAPALKD